MMYLTGSTNDRDEPTLVAAGIGLMVQRGNGYHHRIGSYPFWAADIGMAASDADPYLAYLDALPTRDGCLFAVSPDAYPDAVESLRRGMEFAPLIREMGYPVAVVAQDGAEQLAWPWDGFDVLFIGGKRTDNPADEWKLSPAAESLARQARAHGKWVHFGRVNSLERMERVRSMGANSADGTFVKYRKRRKASDWGDDRDRRGAREVGKWIAFLGDNQPLPLDVFEGPSLPVHREAHTASQP